MHRKGIFISLEGIDGAGKSTFVPHIEKLFRSHGYTVVTTREPGGTPMAEKIRSVMFDTRYGEEDIEPLTEVLLFSAARKQHLENFIKPHLEAGHVVICDRYVDSMIAYQGAGRGKIDEVECICDMVCGVDGYPDYTFYFKIPVDTANRRMNDRVEEDYLDKEVDEYKQRVLAGYERLMAKNRKRFLVVDADATMAMVSNQLSLLVSRITRNQLIKDTQP